MYVPIYDVLENEVRPRAGECSDAADVSGVGDGEGKTFAELRVLSAVVVLVIFRFNA